MSGETNEVDAIRAVLGEHLWHHTRDTHCACGFRAPLAQLAVESYVQHVAEQVAGALHPPVPTDDTGRCPYRNAHYLTNRAKVREDGWRCGKEDGHVNGHYLYSADGETVLDTMGPWVLPLEQQVVTPPEQVTPRMTANEMCTDCPEPATVDQYAGWLRLGDHWVQMRRPMCDFHAHEDARERVEAMTS